MDVDKMELLKFIFKFICGVEGEKVDYDWFDGVDIVRKVLVELLNVKNVVFFLGVGCFLLWVNDKEVGILMMVFFVKEFMVVLKEGD